MTALGHCEEVCPIAARGTLGHRTHRGILALAWRSGPQPRLPPAGLSGTARDYPSWVIWKLSNGLAMS